MENQIPFTLWLGEEEINKKVIKVKVITNNKFLFLTDKIIIIYFKKFSACILGLRLMYLKMKYLNT